MICDKTVWDNSEQYRRATERDLDNWAAWSRQGNGTRLYFASHIPGTSPPGDRTPPAVDIDKAEASEKALSDWRRNGQHGEKGTFLLKLKYVETLPKEAIAYHYSRKFRTRIDPEYAEALIDEAEYFFWLLTQ